jgi:hypothetical protein
MPTFEIVACSASAMMTDAGDALGVMVKSF